MPPTSEDKRLQALQDLNILDTDAEASYDAITDLVTAVTGAHMAAVSLVDRDRQWFKSAVNLPARETPRSWAFCHYAIQQDEIFEVPNALEDPLFAENPLVTGDPHIRAYAGIPIRLPGGEPIGTLCAIHNEPMTLDAAQRRHLASLGRMVEELVAERATSEGHRRLALLAKHTDNAVVFTDRAGRIEWVNPAFERLSGYALEEVLGRKPGDFLQCEDSDQRVVESLSQAVRDATACDVDIVNRSKSGRTYTVHIELMPIREADNVCTGFMAIQSDITEQIATAQRLQQSLEEQRALMGVIREHTIFSQTDVNGVIFDVNDAFCARSGYSADEIIGKTHSQLQSSGLHDQAFWDGLWETLRKGQAWRGDICNRARDGSLFWVDTIAAPLFTPDGRIEKFIFIRFDITQRKKTEDGLVESQARLGVLLDRLSAVTELGGIGSWEVDLESMSPIWDSITCQIHEVPEDYRPDMETAINFYAPEARETISQAVQTCIETGKPWDLELPFITARGRRIWVRAVGRGVFDNGQAIRLVGSFQDITERREREEELRLLKTRLEVALDSSGIGVWDVCPPTGDYLWDEGSRRLFDVSPDAPNPTPAEWREKVHPEDRDGVDRAFAEAFRNKGQVMREYRYQRPDGSYRHIRSFGVYRERLDAPPILTGVHMDVTADIEQAAILEKALERAESSSRAKSEFLANMSHEIRTPLNGVLGMTQVLQLTDLSDQQSRYVDTIRNSGQALADLIDDILDISKIEAGRVELEQASFDLHSLVAVVADMMELRAREKRLALTVDLSDEVDRWVVGDEKRVRQILLNILGNAIKFTEQGEVVVRCRRQADGRIAFSVRDTGPGIAPEKTGQIFDRFAQADTSITRRFGGTGLGLAICRELVELMGGEIGVRSELGEGAEFWFHLPLPSAGEEAAQADAGPMEEPASSGSGRSVLVVDDVEANLMVIAALLGHNGYDVQTARNGQEALDRLEVESFDAVLMDIQMPVMSGDEAIRKLRASGAAYAEMPVFALTADATRATRELCESIRVTGYFTKPLNLPEVLEALSRALPARHMSQPGRSASA